MRQVFWLMTPPTMCELCKHALTDTFIDGATTSGQWAIICPTCWNEGYKKPGVCGLGGALGTGRGQKYTKQPDGRWLKTDG
jgi:hypothetical protein